MPNYLNIHFIVRPDASVNLSAKAPKISVDVIYSQVTKEEYELVPEITTEQTVRIQLDNTLQCTIILEKASRKISAVLANVLAIDGSKIFSRSVTVVKDNDSYAATLILLSQDIEIVSKNMQAIPKDIVFTRSVRLIQTSENKINYTQSQLLVSPIKDKQSLSASDTDIISRLIIAGDNKISSIDATGQQLESLTKIEWLSAQLAPDGTFTCSFAFADRQPRSGWLWWILGEHQIIGFIPDDLSVKGQKHRSFTIALPALSSLQKAVDGNRSENCGCKKGVPLNFTEADMANHPGLYTEDPGSFCKPFSNPERVVSEKSFAVIARVTTPEIGAMSSVNTKSVKLLNFDPAQPSSTGAPTLALSLGMPMLHLLPKDYTASLQNRSSVRGHVNASNPVQWEDDIAQYQAATVAIGHILEFRVRWRSNGYSLGTVVKTLTLAPRQTKRIQKIEWERSERARRSERTQLSDVTNDSVVRERDYQDQVAANLSEWSSGSSHSDAEAVAGGIGFAVGPVVGGVGGGAASANSSSRQDGGRNMTASEHQRLRDAVRRHGDALRKYESMVVNEVTQEETVTGTTEVIRNLNYAHSITVIYYQILRHLRIDTEFAGVRECLFVPFAIKPFDYQRAYRWREALQSSIRSPRYSRALRHLKDVATDFATSDILKGQRAEQPLTYLRGSIFMNLAVERPKDTLDGKYDDKSWEPLKPFLTEPSTSIFAQLTAAVAADRDRFFQSKFAPAAAAKWADRLYLKFGKDGKQIKVDSTLATRYQFNRSVRIDFVVPVEDVAGLTRLSLNQVAVIPIDNLSPGSIANLTGLSFTYSTARFERSIQGRTGVNDLIKPEDGQADSAEVAFPLDAWERVNEIEEIKQSVNDLIEHLNEHVEYYHKAIWWRMDRDRLLMMLDGFYVPNSNNVSIASVVDREPIAIIGNSLVYRVGAAAFMGYGEIDTPEKLHNLYTEQQPLRDPLLVSLPTDGLYAQTIMDECVALEEHYGNLDWALNDADPELGTLDPSLLASRRADTTAATAPTPLPATIINLQNAPDAPAPNGLQGVLNAVTNPNAFRDMAGLAGTQANAQAALNTAANLATSFGSQAAMLELARMGKAQEATRTADQKLATIQRAKVKGLVSAEDATAQANEVIASMNPGSSKGNAPHENPAFRSIIQAANHIPGSTVEATTGDGLFKATMGNDFSPINKQEQKEGFFVGKNGLLSEDTLRHLIRKIASDEYEKWFLDDNGKRMLMDEESEKMFPHLFRYWLSVSGVSSSYLQSIEESLYEIDDYGILIKMLSKEEKEKNEPIFDENWNIINKIEDVENKCNELAMHIIEYAQLKESKTLVSKVKTALLNAYYSRFSEDSFFWSAVFVSYIIRSVAIESKIETDRQGKDVLLKYSSSHANYTAAANERRIRSVNGTYHAFLPTEREIQIGDIIVSDRRNGRTANNIGKPGDIISSHGDIVVNIYESYVMAIGGNIGDGSRRRFYPIVNGKIALGNDEYDYNFSTENDKGEWRSPSSPKKISSNNDYLSSGSTKRIFSLLSLVPDRIGGSDFDISEDINNLT